MTKPISTKAGKPALRNCLLYVIEPGDLGKLAHIEDSLTTPIYGRTVLERNIRLLRKKWHNIHVVLLVKEGFDSELQRILKKISASGNLTLQVVTSLSNCSVPEDGERADHEIDAVLFQQGIGILENLDPTGGTHYCAPFSEANEHRDDKSAPISVASKVRETVQKSESASLIFQRHGATWDRLTRAGICISVSEVPTHFLNETERPIATQLSSYLHAKAALRSVDGPVSRLLLRRLSYRLSRPLSRWGVHPNVATLAAAAFALTAVFLFAIDNRYALFAGGLLWIIGGILDEVDGELARLQGKESEFGSWLDVTFDRIVDALVLVGLAWPIVARSPDADLLILTAIAITLVETSSYIGLLYDRWMKAVLGRTIYFRIGRDTRNLAIFLCAVLAFRIEAIWIVAILSLVELVRRLIICHRVEAGLAAKARSA